VRDVHARLVGRADVFAGLQDLCEQCEDGFHPKTKESLVSRWTAIVGRECDLPASDLEGLKADSQPQGVHVSAAIIKLRTKPRLSVSDRRVRLYHAPRLNH
jgi:hypothetical protein